MDEDRLLGAKVFGIQQRDSGARQLTGAVTGVRGDMLAVTFASPAGWESHGVVLVAGERGSRQTARADVVQERGSVTVFKLSCGWQDFDVRANPRYPTNLDARVRYVRAGVIGAGTVVDISLGGMAVIVPARPAGKEVEVTPRMGFYSATLPCEVSQAGACEGQALLHLRFAELSAQQRAFVRHLVAAAQAAFLEAEEKAS